jgi:hypothetical protein
MNKMLPLSFLLMLIGVWNHQSQAASQSAKGAQQRPAVSSWQSVPAKKEVPAFRYHLDGRGSVLHVDLQLPPGLDLNRWGIHAWIADPAVVEVRVTAIRDLLKQETYIRNLLKDKRCQYPTCQKDLNEILSRFNSQLASFRNYDPFHQVKLCLSSSADPQATMRVETLKAGAKAGEFSAEFEMDLQMDLSRNPHLNQLSAAFKIELLSAIQPGPLSNPTIIALPNRLRFSVSDDIMEDVSMLGTEPILIRPTSGTYKLWRYSETGGEGCLSHRIITAPAFWIDPDSKDDPPDRFGFFGRLFKTNPREEIQLRFFRRTLAVQRHNKKELMKLDLSSDGEESFELLDLQKASDGYALLMEITGYSRRYVGYTNCGAGMENDLVWVLLDRNLKMQKQTSMLIGSCFESADCLEGMKKTPKLWSWEVDNYSQDTKFLIQYNPQKPLNGLDVRSTPGLK